MLKFFMLNISTLFRSVSIDLRQAQTITTIGHYLPIKSIGRRKVIIAIICSALKTILTITVIITITLTNSTGPPSRAAIHISDWMAVATSWFRYDSSLKFWQCICCQFNACFRINHFRYQITILWSNCILIMIYFNDNILYD